MPKYKTKSALFGYFRVRILKNYCHTWNQHLRISVIVKFCEETKMAKFGTKMGFLGLEFENNIVIFEINTLEFV